MVMTDHFGGFTWGDTCEDKVGDRILHFVYNILITAGFGCPQVLLSDNGGDVTNKLVKSMCL